MLSVHIFREFELVEFYDERWYTRSSVDCFATNLYSFYS